MNPRRRLTSATKRALPGALFLLLVVAVYADPLFFRRNFAGRDPLAYHYPVEKAIHDAYARGRLPVWMAEISGGRPLLANPNVGALYPLRPLLAPLPFPFVLRLFPILHWAAAGIGMLVLLRSIAVSRAGAWIGAVTYVFSGVSVSEVFYPNIHPGMTLLPWVLWGVRRRGSSAARKTLTLSIFFALLFLAGDVFTIALALLASVFLVFLEQESAERIRTFAALAGAVGLAALLAAPQILATALWIPETNRAVLGMRLHDVVQFSISPFRLFEFLIPFPFGSTWELDRTQIWGFPLFRGKAVGFFTSLYAGALAVIALVVTRRSRLPGARFARVVLMTGLVLSVLPSLLPSRWGKIPSPLPLRYPEKFAVVLVLALSILTGLAFELIRRFPVRRRWTIAVGATLALLALLVVLFPEPYGWLAVSLIGADPSLAKVAAERLPGALAEGGLLWIVTVIALDNLGRGTRPALLLSLVVLTLVPIVANRRIALTFREQTLFSPTLFAQFLRRADPEGAFRTVAESSYRPASRMEEAQLGSDFAQIELTRRSWDHYTHALWGRGTVFNFDYDGGDLSRIESLRRISSVAAGYRDAGAFFGLFALRWGTRLRDQEPLPGYQRIRAGSLEVWDEHKRAYPDIRLAEKWREEKSALAALNALPRLADGEIVIESDSFGRGAARSGKVSIIEKTPERLLLETIAPDPAWLFVLRAYWNHRSVLLDGESVEYFPAQLAFSAVRIPAGRHQIEWREQAPGWEISRWGPVLFFFVAALLLEGDRRRRRRR